MGMKSLIECSSFSSMGDVNLNRVKIGDDSFGNGSVFELDEECGIEAVEIGKDCFKAVSYTHLESISFSSSTNLN